MDLPPEEGLSFLLPIKSAVYKIDGLSKLLTTSFEQRTRMLTHSLASHLQFETHIMIEEPPCARGRLRV